MKLLTNTCNSCLLLKPSSDKILMPQPPSGYPRSVPKSGVDWWSCSNCKRN